MIGGGNFGNFNDSVSAWNLVATGGFYADGNDDMVLSKARPDRFWDASIVAGGATVGGGNVGNFNDSINAWNVVGTGNFFSNGDMGLALQDTTGQIFLLDMKGNTVAGGAKLGNFGADWRVAGTGDFFGDGNTDLVLQDTSGQIFLLDVRDTIVASGNVGNFNGSVNSWQVVATGNFTGDGNTDIVLQDTTGQIKLLDMQGSSVVGNQEIGNFGPTWHVKEAGQLFGDGKEELVLQNTTGQIFALSFNGSQLTGGVNIGNFGTSWVVPPHLT